jgi:hypothetical protein
MSGGTHRESLFDSIVVRHQVPVVLLDGPYIVAHPDGHLVNALPRGDQEAREGMAHDVTTAR